MVKDMVNMKNPRKHTGPSCCKTRAPESTCGFFQVTRNGSAVSLLDLISIAAVVIYVVSQILFQHTSLLQSYPWLTACSLPVLFECIAVALACVALAVRCPKLQITQVIIIFLSITLLGISAYNTNDSRLLHSFIIIASISWSKIADVLKVYGFAVLIIVIVCMILSISGILYNKDVIPNERLVYSFGFLHPNAVASFLFSATSALSLAYWDRKNWWIPEVLLLICALFSYGVASSHAAGILNASFSLLAIVFHRLPCNNNNVMKKAMLIFLVTVPLALTALMYACIVWYEETNSFFILMDRVTHFRPLFAHRYYLSVETISLFGKPYEVLPNYHTGIAFQNVDSGYCFLILVYGLGSLVTLVITYLYAIPKIVESKGALGYVLLIVMCSLYMIIENFPLYIALSPALLILSCAFQKRTSKTSDL